MTGILERSSALSLRAHQLGPAGVFAFADQVEEPGLRVEIYEDPDPQHVYCLGFDAAYGLEGRDCDAICVLDKDTNPVRQVAEVQGHLGEKLDRIVYALARLYNDAFVVGERQVGLPTLRRLHDEYAYSYMFYERKEDEPDRPFLDTLGYHTKRYDVTLRSLRLAVVEDAMILRSKLLIQQMGRLEFREPTTADKMGERRRDGELKIKLAGGGSPDLVMALNGAWLGIGEVERFEKPKTFREQALDAWLGTDDRNEGKWR